MGVWTSDQERESYIQTICEYLRAALGAQESFYVPGSLEALVRAGIAGKRQGLADKRPGPAEKRSGPVGQWSAAEGEWRGAAEKKPGTEGKRTMADCRPLVPKEMLLRAMGKTGEQADRFCSAGPSGAVYSPERADLWCEALSRVLEPGLRADSGTAGGTYFTSRPVVILMCRLALWSYLGQYVQCLGLRPSELGTMLFEDRFEISEGGRAALLRMLSGVRIIDPAVGSGAFLSGMLREIMRLRAGLGDSLSGTALRREIIDKNLFGVDREENAVETVRLILDLLADRKGRNGRIELGDSLFLNWNELFPAVMDSGGFDILLANPPYVSQERLSREYKTQLAHWFRRPPWGLKADGRRDIFVYFYALAGKLLKTGGVGTFITSSAWLDVEYGVGLQNYLLDNFRLPLILDSSRERWFSGAAINTAVVVLQRNWALNPEGQGSGNGVLSERKRKDEDVTKKAGTFNGLKMSGDSNGPKTGDDVGCTAFVTLYRKLAEIPGLGSGRFCSGSRVAEILGAALCGRLSEFNEGKKTNFVSPAPLFCRNSVACPPFAVRTGDAAAQGTASAAGSAAGQAAGLGAASAAITGTGSDTDSAAGLGAISGPGSATGQAAGTDAILGTSSSTGPAADSAAISGPGSATGQAVASNACPATASDAVSDSPHCLRITLAALAGLRAGIGKWGRFLRAPQVYFELAETAGSKFQPLGTIAQVKRGFTTGWNEFFYIRTGQDCQVEPEHLRQVLKSPRETPGFRVDPAKLNTRVVLLSGELADLGPGARSYIGWGESAGGPERPTLAVRKPWWALPVKEFPVLGFRRFFFEKFNLPYLPEDILVDQTFYGIYYAGDPLVLAAILNSTVAWLFIELHGRTALGEGALQYSVGEAEGLPILDPATLGPDERNKLSQAFVNLAQRNVLNLREELAAPDRRKLDDLVLQGLGVGNQGQRDILQKQVAEGFGRLVEARLQKSATNLEP